MDPTFWALYVVITVGLLAAALLHYRRNEPAGRGRYVLGGLRGLALAVILLLLFDPALPARGAAARATVALVDASLSMRLASPDGTTRWQEAVRAVHELAPDRIVVFGAGPGRAVPSLDDVEPDQPATVLGPAIRSALEAGAGRVVVVTDAAVQDADDVTRLASDARLPVTVHGVGERTAWNAGLVELDAPAWAPADDEVEVRITVGRIGEAAPDSVGVRLRWGEEVLARATVPMPPEGRVSPASLRFTPPSAMADWARLDAELLEGGAEPADDRRSVYIRVAEQPAGVVLVSFLPDQEPRFLLPVLERALGLPARGWLAVGPGRFVRLGVGRDAGLTDAEAEVRRAAAAADLVVLHGLDGSEPAWAREAARLRPALLFPRAAHQGLPVRPAPPLPGDWYPDPDVPPSPASPFLAGVRPEDAPPLSAVRTAEAPTGWWAPLHARQDRRGEARPVLLAGQLADRRVAVALADGYWRWAFAEEGGRALYEALWAGVVAWLADEDLDRVVAGVRPERRVVPRGEPLRWLAPPTADSVRVTLHPLAEPAGAAEGPSPETGPARVVGLDTVLSAAEGVAIQTAPGPGHYRYEVRAFLDAGGLEPMTGSGELTVERYSPEFTRPARPLRWETDARGVARAGAASPRRPLRAVAWPYVALVVLLCAEWVLRRRWGLR